MAEPFLIGDAMTGGYGAADILHSCTIAVDKGQIAVIVGPNGAGKSTAMKAVFGMLKLRSGHVRLGGEDITALSPQARVAKGMAFVPQTQNIFTSMTVEENLEMGAFLRRDDIRTTLEQIYTLFPILRDKRRQAAGGTNHPSVFSLFFGGFKRGESREVTAWTFNRSNLCVFLFQSDASFRPSFECMEPLCCS